MSIAAPVPKITGSSLKAAGLTPEQIDKLIRLRTRYDPALEQFDTNREFRRLAFLKWRYETGRVREYLLV